MESYSPSKLIKQVETQVNMILRKTDWSEVSEKGRKAVMELGQFLSDARIYAHDYEFSETREEQVDSARKAHVWLEQAQHRILRASEHSIFGAIDVAHLTAQLDQAKADLK